MNAGLGRLCIAACLLAAGGCCVWVITLENRVQSLRTVSAEPGVDPAEVAAVIKWAQGGAGRWTAVPAHPGEARVVSAAVVEPAEVNAGRAAEGAVIAVPGSAQAGGGKVSTIEGGRLHSGSVRTGSTVRRSASPFTKALGRSLAPVSSRRRR